MTSRQVWRSVVVEAGVVGLAGALVGIVSGLLVGALMVVLAGGRLELAAAIPWPVVLIALVLAALGMWACGPSARLAARASITRFVAYEPIHARTECCRTASNGC